MNNNQLPEDASSNELVHHHGPVHSEPVLGHDGTSFETVDAKAGTVVSSLAIIAGTLVVVFALTVGIQRLLEKANPPGQLPSPIAPARVIPPVPQLQVHPWDELPDLRAHAESILNSYGKDASGRTHIPIDQAIDSVQSRLTIVPGALKGLMTPGGEGRPFADSLNAMPEPYKKPAIQGEIRKGVN